MIISFDLFLLEFVYLSFCFILQVSCRTYAIDVGGPGHLLTTMLLVLSEMALPLSPSTIQSIVVPLSVQATPSVAGSSGMPPVTQASEPLINMPHAAMQLAVMQPAAMPLSATHSIMSVRPNQMGYFTGAPSAFNTQSTQFPNMSNPIWKVSQREQRLQNQLLQERQQFKAWKALHAQPHVSQMQAPPIVSSGPTVSEKVKIDDVEVISLRSASTKRARSRDQATATT